MSTVARSSVLLGLHVDNHLIGFRSIPVPKHDPGTMRDAAKPILMGIKQAGESVAVTYNLNDAIAVFPNLNREEPLPHQHLPRYVADVFGHAHQSELIAFSDYLAVALLQFAPELGPRYNDDITFSLVSDDKHATFTAIWPKDRHPFPKSAPAMSAS